MRRADAVRDVVDVAGDVGALRADVLVVEADADDAARVAHRVELRIGEVAGRGHERVRARVGDHERLGGDLRDVPEPALVEVGEVDEDPERVALAHERAAGVGEPRADVRRGGRRERHAVPERVRPAPRDAERAQPERVQRGQALELRVDRLRALDVHDRPDRPAARGRGRRPSRTTRTAPSLLEREQLPIPASVAGMRQRVRDGRLGRDVGPRAASSGKPSGCGVKIAKKPPANPPARARSRSRWPSSERSLNERSASSTSLCPSKTGRPIAIR